MSEILAYCGIICSTCPIYLVTRESNREKQAKKRLEIAKLIGEHYGTNYEAANITDCDGCLTKGERIFSGCKDCLIRSCAQLKFVENCAYCPEYSCERLVTFFSKDPQAKTRLENVRKRVK
jgi:hypothetical protein